MSLPADLRNTSQVHLDQFVADQVREGPHLDYKRALPSAWTNDAKHEFVADATAFANAGGGDLIFGIDEDAHAQAVALVPLALPSVDQEVRRLQDFLLNLAEPRIPGAQVHPVSIAAGGIDGVAIIVRVPQSWAGPHRVRTNQHFYVRDGARKRQLDVPEIRSLFLRSDSQAQRIRDFRIQRLGQIFSGETPHKMVDGPVLIVHFVPTQAALGLVQIDPVPYTSRASLPVIGAGGGRLARLNIDGALVVRNETPQGETHGYSQFFRSGFFESTMVISRIHDGHRLLPSQTFEQHLLELFGAFRAELTWLGLGHECSIMLSLLRANEVQLGVRNTWNDIEPHQTRFDRKTLVLPDVLAEAESAIDRALKPAIDFMWQAAGFKGSQSYNNAGDWAPK